MAAGPLAKGECCILMNGTPWTAPHLLTPVDPIHFAAVSQTHAGHPLSRTIFHVPLASRLQTELKVPMRFPEGSRTGPDVIASSPELRTSTCSGSHENGADFPPKNFFQRSVTS